MDYDALAKQYGGAVAASAVDFDALAKQFGGVAKGADAIPGQRSTSKKERELGIIEQVASLPLTAATAITSGPAALAGMWGEALGSKETGAAIRKALTFPTYTEAQQRQLEALGGAMEAAHLPPTLGGAGIPLNALAGPATAQGVNALGKAAQPVVAAVKQPLAQRAARIAEEQSAADWARASQIEAAQAMQRLGIAGNPAKTNPSVKTKMLVGVAGEPTIESTLSRKNRPRWNEIAREDMGLPKNTPLNAQAFETARAAHAAPYEKISKLGTLAPDDAVVTQVEKLKLDPLSTSDPQKAATVNGIIDRVVNQMNEGLSGENVVGQIRDFRKDANRTLKNPNASPIDADVAEAKLGIANALENLVESNIRDPKALSEFRAARTAMAKTYDWERVTGTTTKQVDPLEVVKLAEKGKPLTGALKDVADVAGNFPGIASLTDEKLLQVLQHVPRTSIGGTIGGIVGGFPGAAIGAGVGVGTSKLAANMLARPSMQNRLAVPVDRRIPLAQAPAAEFSPIPSSNALVPYDYAQQTFEAPNFVLRPNEYPPRAQFVGPESGPPQLGYGGTMETLAAEKARAAAMSRTLGQQREAQQAAAEAASRQPTRGAVEMQINPLTGLPEISKGLKGATPETFQNFGTSLKSASEKVASGQQFAMDAAELAAWKKTSADLAEIMPGFKALDEKVLAERMMDRKWATDAVSKAREKAAAFEEIAKRAADDLARREAIMRREQMLELADTLEENLRGGRPVSKTGQGPKTRAHQRNALAEKQEPRNAIVIELNNMAPNRP